MQHGIAPKAGYRIVATHDVTGRAGRNRRGHMAGWLAGCRERRGAGVALGAVIGRRMARIGHTVSCRGGPGPGLETLVGRTSDQAAWVDRVRVHAHPQVPFLVTGRAAGADAGVDHGSRRCRQLEAGTRAGGLGR